MKISSSSPQNGETKFHQSLYSTMKDVSSFGPFGYSRFKDYILNLSINNALYTKC